MTEGDYFADFSTELQQMINKARHGKRTVSERTEYEFDFCIDGTSSRHIDQRELGHRYTKINLNSKTFRIYVFFPHFWLLSCYFRITCWLIETPYCRIYATLFNDDALFLAVNNIITKYFCGERMR